jgi:hypothetical protein
MDHFKTTHETDWRRVRWVHDTDYNPVGSYAFADDKETQAAVDVELTGLQSGAFVVLGALVELKCPHCKMWQDEDSLWGIVVDSDEDLEAWGTDNLSIPELPEAMDCADTGVKSPNDDTPPDDTERRQIPLSPEAQDYVERAAETPPEDSPEESELDKLRQETFRAETSRDAAVFRYGLVTAEHAKLKGLLRRVAEGSFVMLARMDPGLGYAICKALKEAD